MLTIPSPSESVAVYAGDSSSIQLLALTHESYCNLHGLAVVSNDGIQFDNQPRFEDSSHHDAAAETLLLAAADAQLELRLIVHSVEGIEVRAIERIAISAAIEYGEYVFAIDSYALMIEATSSAASLASLLDAGVVSDAPLQAATLHAAPLQAAPLQAAEPRWALPVPAPSQGDDRFAAFYTLEPLHPTLPKPLGLADLARGRADAAICGAPDAP